MATQLMTVMYLFNQIILYYNLIWPMQCSEDDVRLCRGRLKYGDNVCYSRITDETLWRHLPVDSHSNCVILVCGTRIFNKDMVKLLITRGFNKDKYFMF